MGGIWRNGFSNIIAARGISYFRSGKVKKLETHTMDDMVYFSAQVEGSHTYAVSGQYISGKALNLSCSCPYEFKCKHMYAVLCAVEDKFRSEDVIAELKNESLRIARKRRIYPFSNETDVPLSGYKFFDFSRITQDFYITEENYENARELVSSLTEKSDITIQNDDGYGGSVCRASIHFINGNSRERSCFVAFSKDEMISYSCEDYSCMENRMSSYGRRRKNEPCVHVLGCLLLAEDYIKKNDLGDSTNSVGSRFLTRFLAGTRSGRNMEGQNNVALLPRIILRGGRIFAGFKVGTDKLYVVKNLSQLKSAVTAGHRYPLGKNTYIDFSVSHFSEKSENLFKLISRELEHFARLEDALYGGAHLPKGSSMQEVELFGDGLDLFFLSVEGMKLDLKDEDDSISSSLRFVRNDPSVFLILNKYMDSEGNFQGVELHGTLPVFVRGENSLYYLDLREREDPLFCCISPEAAERLQPILSETYGEDINVRIGRRRLPEFYHSALPVLRACCEVMEPDQEFIESQLPPAPVITFYLDTDDGLPVCRGEAKYGDDVFPIIDALDEERPFISKRIITLEKPAAEKMLDYFPNPGSMDSFSCLDDNDAIFSLIHVGIDELKRYGDVQCTAAFQNLMIHRNAEVHIGITSESDLLNLQITSDISPRELLDVLHSYKLRKKFHRLKDGSFIDITAVIADLSDMLDSLHISPKEFCSGNMNIPAYRALYLDRMLEENPEMQADRDSHFRSLVRNYKTVADSDFEVPEVLRNILRPYQVYGYKWLRMLQQCHFGGILADDMGLGKTLQTIAVLLAASMNGGGTSLIVCPSSLVFNWMDEFARFAPSLRCIAVAGSAEEREPMISQYEQYDVLITSYDTLKRDISSYENCRFSFEVLDEAQYIKNHTTVAAKSVKLIQSRYRFALTGTPIENRLSELWSIFDFLMPGFLYGYETFRKEMETPITKHGEKDVSARLRKMVSPFILRRLKSDVLKDLPEKIEEDCYIRLGSDQQKIYDGQVVRIRQMLSSPLQSSQHRMAILAELTKIRQICCDPSLLFEDYSEPSAKRTACMDLIHSAMEGGHRILLFSQFTSMLELLEEDLEKESITYFKITGATPKAERVKLVNDFNSGDVPLFLISLKAGGTGLNLTGADTVIHYDPWWNVAAMNQATDRAHRIGQKNVVTVYKMIAKGTIEEKILEMQKNKKALADDILSENSANLLTMSSEELLEILG